jgi:Glycosyltransferase Family 4
MKKKALILAYDFPPNSSVGSKRPESWYKYFNLYNIHPIVITIDNINFKKDSENEINENGTVIKSTYKYNLIDKLVHIHFKSTIIRKLLTAFYSVFEFIFFIGPKSTIYYSAKKYLTKNKVDYIIATGEPFVLFKYADKLSHEFKIPWIADYRDGWTTNYQYKLNYINKLDLLLNKIYFKKIEKKYSSRASLYTTVSESIKNDLLNINKNRSIEVIYNGYDEEIINSKSIINQNSDYMEIAYAGTIYPYQRLDIFLEGCADFLKNSTHKIKIKFYGLEYFPERKDEILNHNGILKDFIEISPTIPHSEVIKKLQRANILLLLAGNIVDGSAAKLYEYLALKRKIMLVINDNGTAEKIIKQTNSGIICENKSDVCLNLEKLYKEWTNSKNIECKSSNFEIYSRKNQAKKLVELLNKIDE